MTADFEILNPLDDPRWDERIGHFSGATPFHSSAWARVLVRAFGYTPVYLCRRDGERLSACLPVMEIKRTFAAPKGKTLPFTDYCDPLLVRGDSGDLLQAIVTYGRSRRWRSYELRGGTWLEASTPSVRACFGHSISLEGGADGARSRFSGSARRHLRRAEGIVAVRRGDSAAFLEIFLRLHRKTRKRQGLFVQPSALFRAVLGEVLTKGMGFVSLAYADGRPIAGAIYIHWNGRASYVYGASDARYQYLRPNNAVMWDAVQWFAEHGCRELDLGITDSENCGLRQYKNTMASHETLRRYFRYDYRRAEFQSGYAVSQTNLRVALCKRLPVAALSCVGRLLYPRHG